MQGVATDYRPAPGPHAIDSRAWTLTDAARHRVIRVRLYAPAQPDGRVPLVLFSPGLGASCDDYSYLGRHWASYGYACVHLSHPGTDDTLLQDNPRPWPAFSDALDDWRHWLDRPRDMHFVLDELQRNAETARLCDFTAIAAGGHSYGAFTAMALAGLRFHAGPHHDVDLRDDRIGAVVAMSTQGPGTFGLHEDSWRDIRVPLMCLTGTRDRGLRSKQVEERFVAHARIDAPDQYLVVIKRANHWAFGDTEGLGVGPRRDPAHHGYVQMATTAFLDRYLRSRTAAQRWLVDGGLTAATDGNCRIEWKNLTTP